MNKRYSLFKTTKRLMNISTPHEKYKTKRYTYLKEIVCLSNENIIVNDKF